MRQRLSVAVAMTTFNGERFLGQQLESLESQTQLPDEIQIVDDASTDATLDLLRQFQARNAERVSLRVADANRGADTSFVEAIGACSADLILPCDQDDRWRPEKIERLARRVEEEPNLGMVASDSGVIGENGEKLAPSFWERMGVSQREVRRCNAGHAFRVLLRHPFVSGHGMAFRRVLLRGAVPLPRGWTYDEWLGVVMAAQAPVLLLRECLVDHRLHTRQAVGHSGEPLWLKLRSQELERERLALDRQVVRAEALNERLEAIERSPELGQEVRRVAEARLAFVRARRLMRDSSPGRRAALIVRELFFGRYWSVGRGFLAVARDALLR